MRCRQSKSRIIFLPFRSGKCPCAEWGCWSFINQQNWWTILAQQIWTDFRIISNNPLVELLASKVIFLRVLLDIPMSDLGNSLKSWWSTWINLCKYKTHKFKSKRCIFAIVLLLNLLEASSSSWYWDNKK